MLPELGRADPDRRTVRVRLRERQLGWVTGACDEVCPVPLEENDLPSERLDHVIGSEVVRITRRGVGVAVDPELEVPMSGVSVGRFGMLIWNEMIPASLFDTTIVVMSGA